MTIKEQVLGFLEKNKGGFISGSDMASELYISRNAVWKAIKQLKEEGYNIESVNNKGYCLAKENTIVSAQSICKYLKSDIFNIETFKTVGSTNTVLKQKAEAGAKEGTVIIAEEQTEGKGRQGRPFFSPKNTGIYMSLLLRPQIPAEEALNITTAAAVSVANVLEKTSGKKMEIKWVNDIFCEGLKVCGILTEASLDFESGGLNYAILGIGINIFVPEENFPAELDSIATSIFENEKNADIRSLIIAEILNSFMEYYKNLSNREYYDEYKDRSMIIGKEIDIIRKGEKEKALALDIDKNFRLKVLNQSGIEEYLSSGEVSIKKR